MIEPAVATRERVEAREAASARLLLSDLASIVLFAGLGSFFASALEPILAWRGAGPEVRALGVDAVLVGSALVAFFAAGKERGLARRASPAAAALLAAFAAVATAVASALTRGEWPFGSIEPSPLALAARTGLVLAGAPLVLVGSRFDRLEEGWRAAARERPPEATPAFAYAVARFRPPRALELLLLPLAPLGLALALVGLVAIRLYQLTLSRLMPPVCRFEPSCSRYAFQALRTHGAIRGTVLSAFRVARCQPFCTDGHDPVPPVHDPGGGASR